MTPAARVATGLALLAGAHANAWAEGPEVAGRSPGALLAQALLSLAVVVGVIYLVYFGLRRLSERGLGAQEDGPMHIVQARHLGGDRWIYLVEVEGRRIVIGGTDGQVTPIVELEPSDAPGTGGERRDEI